MKSQEFLTEENGLDVQIRSVNLNSATSAAMIRAASRHMIRLGYWRDLAELSYMIGDTASSCGVLPMEMLLKPKQNPEKVEPSKRLNLSQWLWAGWAIWGGLMGYFLGAA